MGKSISTSIRRYMTKIVKRALSEGILLLDDVCRIALYDGYVYFGCFRWAYTTVFLRRMRLKDFVSLLNKVVSMASSCSSIDDVLRKLSESNEIRKELRKALKHFGFRESLKILCCEWYKMKLVCERLGLGDEECVELKAVFDELTDIDRDRSLSTKSARFVLRMYRRYQKHREEVGRKVVELVYPADDGFVFGCGKYRLIDILIHSLQ